MCIRDSYCMTLHGVDGWLSRPCNNKKPFICKYKPPQIITGQKVLKMAYTIKELTFRSFRVWYQYQAASQQLLDSWQEKQMTGFKLSWLIEDVNGTIINEINDIEKPTGWKTAAASKVASDTIRAYTLARAFCKAQHCRATQIHFTR